MKHLRTLVFALILLVPAACSDNPVSDDHEHAEIEGLALLVNGEELVIVGDAQVAGDINLNMGQEADLTVEWHDHDGDHFHDEDLDPVLSLGHMFLGDSDVVRFERHHEEGRWIFHLHALKAGTTTLELQVLNVDHVDFRTPPISVTVTP